MPSLSVIVPVYNVEAFLPVCIDSILTQTLQDLELILIDDGSPDRCGAICDEYAVTDPRVKVIHQKNSGVSAARNAGLKVASGAYIGFVDPDDWIAPEMFASLLMAAQEHHAQIAVCGFTFCDEFGRTKYNQAVPEGLYDQDALLMSIYGMPNKLHGSMCNKLFSRTVLEDVWFIESVAIGEDWLLLYECYCQTNLAVAISDCFYYVRSRNGSATRKADAGLYIRKLQAYLALYKKAVNHPNNIRRQAAEKILDVCVANKLEICKLPDNARAVSYVNRLFRRLSLQSFLRRELPLNKAVYYFREGLKFGS